MFRLIVALIILVALSGLLVFAGTTLVPHSNPSVTYTINWDSHETEMLVRETCYDCHSNETVYPWYAYVAPSAYLVSKDVIEGRDNLNFSTNHGLDLDKMVEKVASGEMPPTRYTLLHPEANLNAIQRDMLIIGLKATFMQENVGARVEMTTATQCTTDGEECAPANPEATLEPAALMPDFGQPAFGGKLDVDRDTVGEQSRLPHQLRVCVRDGLEVNVTAKIMHLAQLARDRDDLLHRIVGRSDDARRQE